MGVQLQMKQGELIALLDGEIDHHGARELREEIDAAAQRTKPRLLTLDFPASSLWTAQASASSWGVTG